MPKHTPDYSGDLALARRILEGDETASEELVRKYSGQLNSFAREHHVIADDCQDVVQEAFIAAVSQIRRGRYRGEASLGTWLHTILRGKISDYFRRIPRRGSDQLEYLDKPCDQKKLVLDESEQLITYLEVAEAMHRIQPRSRVILLMKIGEGLTIEELSQWLGVSIGKANRELQKAQKEFRRQLLNEEPPGNKRKRSNKREK